MALKRNFSILLFFLLAGVTGFNLNAQLVSNVTVFGTVENAAPGTKVHLMELMGQGMQPIDSVKIKSDKSFSISANIKNANFYQLTLGGQSYTILILEPNQNVHIDLDANNLMAPKNIKGSPDTKKVYEMLNVFNSYKAQQNALEAEYQKVYGTPQQDSVGKVLLQKYQTIENLKTNYLKSEVSNSPSLATLLFIDQLKIDDNIALYENLDKVLYAKYPQNAFVSDLHRRVASKLRLAVGRPAPEINLPTPEGKYVKLSSLRGKVVLIDFWASWCSPCRRESPNMVRLYNKYHDKGFEIYSVSFDKEKSSWIKAINDDGLNWTHVSDLRYWNSIAGQDYGVKSIPFTVLIDEKGNIIATGLRGPALEQKLAEIFSK